MIGPIFKIKDDARITKVGRFLRYFSIDDLPNFFNVLLGDICLLGTRTPTIDKHKDYMHIAKLNGRVCGAKRPHSVSEQPIYIVSL